MRKGFTLVELFVVVAIVALLAAIAIPNFVASEGRAREGALRSNMHAFQVAAEDWRVRNDSTYAGDAADVAALLLPGFSNPFDRSVGGGAAWENRESFTADPTARSGITSYSDSSDGASYNIKGYGKSATLALVLSNGP